MYDASLDQLELHSWRFWLDFTRIVPYAECEEVYTVPPYWRFNFPMRRLECNPLVYSSLDFFDRDDFVVKGVQMYKSNAVFGRRKTEEVFFEEEMIPGEVMYEAVQKDSPGEKQTTRAISICLTISRIPRSMF
jgi:hypothetical protein